MLRTKKSPSHSDRVIEGCEFVKKIAGIKTNVQKKPSSAVVAKKRKTFILGSKKR